MVVRPVQFLSCLRSVTLRSVLAAVVGALIAAGGCARGAQPVASQPFRDERDPGDGFQFHEGAVPAEDEKSDSAEVTTETTIEIDVDEEAADSTTSDDEAADAAGDDSSSDEGGSSDDEAPDDGDDDGDDASGLQLPAP